jgi:acetyl esterase/lipase
VQARQVIFTTLLMQLAAGALPVQAAEEPAQAVVLDVWPAGPPGTQSAPTTLTVVDRSAAGALRDRAATGITKPSLTVFRADEPDGSALLIIPGGAYERVVMDKEGYESARWFAERGTTAFVLLYRLPGESWSDGADVVLQDAQRAMRVIRSSAEDYGIDRHRVGVMGFSAGGHAAALLATRFDDHVYAPVDASDKRTARPDFAVLMYPVIFMEGNEAHAGSRVNLLGSDPRTDDVALHSPQLQVSSATPPTFLLHAADDESVVPANSMTMHSALIAAGVESELHIFAEGGHGFGIRGTTGLPVVVWPELVHAWMQEILENTTVSTGQ